MNNTSWVFKNHPLCFNANQTGHKAFLGETIPTRKENNDIIISWLSGIMWLYNSLIVFSCE